MFLRKITLTLTTIWLVSYAAILVQMPDPDPLLLAFSLLYLVYYFGLSLYISGKMLKARRVQQAEA
jgi:phosphatidylcholine synthase